MKRINTMHRKKTSEASPLPKGSYERLYASGMLKEIINTFKYMEMVIQNLKLIKIN